MRTRSFLRLAAAGLCAGAIGACTEAVPSMASPGVGPRLALLREHAGEEALLLLGDHGCGPDPAERVPGTTAVDRAAGRTTPSGPVAGTSTAPR